MQILSRRQAFLLAFPAVVAVTSCRDTAHEPVGVDPSRSAGVVDSLAPMLQMQNPNRIPGRYIVRFKPDVADAEALAHELTSASGGKVYKALRGLKGFWGELPEGSLEAVRRNQHVRYIEADLRMPVNAGDTVKINPAWTLDRIDQRNLPLNQMYQYSVSGTGVHIWIIDTGIDRNEPELTGRISETEFSTIYGKDPFAPCYTHGTLMAVTAAGTSSGVAKNATIHSARVDSDCDGNLSTGAASSAFEFIGDYATRPAVINYSASDTCGFLGCGQGG